jgi:hypothetical protein
MLGDGLCGLYGGDTVLPGINNEQVMQNAKNDFLFLKENIVNNNNNNNNNKLIIIHLRYFLLN